MRTDRAVESLATEARVADADKDDDAQFRKWLPGILIVTALCVLGAFVGLVIAESPFWEVMWVLFGLGSMQWLSNIIDGRETRKLEHRIRALEASPQDALPVPSAPTNAVLSAAVQRLEQRVAELEAQRRT